ncbi:MAG: small multi-drug export protein [Clostridia bacterium]|nr:small multi-drug export protein [Clostridia bacterium]
MDNLITQITQALQNSIPSELIVFIISLFPILELRGGIIAATILGIPWQTAYIICVIGNLLPIPFILLFLDKIFEWLKKTRFKGLVDKLESKAMKKSETVKKYKFWGLFAFVAIPLPGTGAWTGALVASFLRMKLKDSILPIILGVLTAGIIVALASYGILNLFFV